MNTHEAFDILEAYLSNKGVWGSHFDEALTHAIEHMKRGAPEGWQLVPKEPTNLMCDAGSDKFECINNGNEYGSEQIYKAMLSAAPEPPRERKD